MRQLPFVAITTAALLAGAPTLAADTSAPPGVTVIHLTERAERVMARDHLRGGLAVEVTGPVASQVQAEINRRMEAALAKAKSVSTVKAETGGYSVYPQRDPGKPTLWHGQQTLNLSSDAPADLLTLVGDLQQQGLATQGLTFEVAEETLRKAEDGLTADALAALRQRAETVATDLGMTVQQIRDVTIGNAEGGARPPMPVFAMRAAAPAAAPPPVAEPGDAEVSVTVQAEVWLAPKGQ
ncbi:MAG TPA: SIMPL domain-containing protein [Stellaceae bacterium]|nr:SIMPL domain-containing protein [Stellaceae bacterium]